MNSAQRNIVNRLSVGLRADDAAWVPGWAARVVIAVAIILALTVWVAGRIEDPPYPLDDSGFRNVLLQASAISSGVATWAWFCFRSRYPRRLRLGVLASPAVAAVIFFGAVASWRSSRVVDLTGSLVPRLAPAEHDIATFAREPITGQADLDTTTPADFPQFLGPERNCWISEPRLKREWQANPPRELWRRPIGAGYSAFAAVNGFAITQEQRGSEEWVVCYQIETGKQVWGHAIEARHETALGGVGPRGTPAIHNGRVYALGATGVLRCLDGTGNLVWSDDLRKRYGISDTEDEQNVMFGRAASPLVVDSFVVVPGGGPKGKSKNLVAFDLQTGWLAWEAENKLSNGTADQIAYASPSLVTLAGRRQILIVNESTVSGHDPATGQRLWSHPWAGKSNGDASASQAVAVDPNRVFVSKGYGGGAELIELTAGAEDKLTAATVWKNPRVLQTKFSNAVLHKGHAFGLSEGILECATLESGRRAWKKGRYGHGQILGVGDLLLAISEEGELHLLELNTQKLAHLGSVPALSGKTWNNLCLYGKRLLVRNAEEAACFELP